MNAFASHTSQIYFPLWIYDLEAERQMVKKLLITALWSIQMKPNDRPRMKKVVEMLEGNVVLLEMPPNQAFPHSSRDAS